MVWLGRWLSLCLLLLLASTYRLWLDQQWFPQVPLITVAGRAPWWVDAVLLVLLGVGIAGGLVGRWRWTWWLVFLSLAGLFVLDQHRLQPWAYHAALLSVVFAVSSELAAYRLITWLTASLYIYSALGKFDWQFSHTMGPQLLQVLVQPLGFDVRQWSDGQRVAGSLALAAGELLVGVGILVPGLRRWAGLAAAGMHLVLIGCLGPWGLAHQPAVLVWNLYFLGQALGLFVAFPRGTAHRRLTGSTAVESKPGSAPPERSALAPLAVAVVTLAILMPALEPWGWWDHWLSWGLYSPRNSRAGLWVHRGAVERLPPHVQLQLEARPQQPEWVRVRLDRWSLATLGAPVYPQARFFLGTSLGLARQAGLKQEVMVVQQGMADRWTGRRVERTWRGRDDLSVATEAFLFGAQPAPSRP